MANIERLEMLRDLLLNLPERLPQVKEFNMTKWQCGTAACALGSACLYPLFNEQGLKLEDYFEYENRTTVMVPYYDGYNCYFAGAAFFDIPLEYSFFLFEPAEYPVDPAKITPQMVADRVQKIIDLQS